jgi:hypothetical protein
MALHADLLIPTVREEITKHSNAQKDKLLQHPNQLIPFLLEEEGPKRLKRHHPTDLTQILITQISHGSGIKWRVFTGTRIIMLGLYRQRSIDYTIHVLIVP